MGFFEVLFHGVRGGELSGVEELLSRVGAKL
jgi:hypothetical protein